VRVWGLRSGPFSGALAAIDNVLLLLAACWGYVVQRAAGSYDNGYRRHGGPWHARSRSGGFWWLQASLIDSLPLPRRKRTLWAPCRPAPLPRPLSPSSGLLSLAAVGCLPRLSSCGANGDEVFYFFHCGSSFCSRSSRIFAVASGGRC
jgi:hypothetical protein